MVVGYAARVAQVALKAARYGNQQIVKQWTPIVGKGQASGIGIAVEIGTGIGIWLSDYMRSNEDGGNIVATPPPVQRQHNRFSKARGAFQHSAGCRRKYKNGSNRNR